MVTLHGSSKVKEDNKLATEIEKYILHTEKSHTHTHTTNAKKRVLSLSLSFSFVD